MIMNALKRAMDKHPNKLRLGILELIKMYNLGKLPQNNLS
jgi:hypothetical protein